LKLALDTNAYRALRDGDPGLTERVRAAEAVALPIVVVGELRFGFQNGTRLEQNEELLERFLRTPRVEVLHVTLATTWLYGEVATVLRARGVALLQNDIWIAALCKQYAFALATRDRGFRQVIGLQVIEF
jgi:predicted nucleic acid-binding protein